MARTCFLCGQTSPRAVSPFTIETRPLDPLEGTSPLTDYILTNPATGEWAKILPSHGGMLRQLVLRHANTRYSVINSPASPQALLADETYASALLYPFPSRIEHGTYVFDGTTYTLPLNEPLRQNALHGLVHTKPFTVVDHEVTPHHARLTLCHEYDGHVPGYPFLFALTVTYTLANEGLTLAFEALNTGAAPCPAAFGWHPYFSLNKTPLDELTLHLPTQTEVVLDERLIATGTKAVDAHRHGAFSLKNIELDTPFLVETSNPSVPKNGVTVLAWPAENVSLALTQSASLGYVVVYTPGRRDSIAIEPQTANVNAFNNHEGLCVLAPGQRLAGQMAVTLQ